MSSTPAFIHLAACKAFRFFRHLHSGRAALPLLFCTPAVLPAEDLKLTFEVTQETSKPAQPPKTAAVKTIEKFTMTAVLGSDHSLHLTDSVSSYIDFRTRRIVNVRHSDHLFSDLSLYSLIGFYEAEFLNRIRVGELINRVRLGQAFATTTATPGDHLDPMFLAHRFSLRPPTGSPLLVSSSPTRTSYAHGGKPLASFELSGFALSETDAAHFTRFLRHSYHLHPDILAALQKLKIVPHQFTVTHHEIATKEYQFTLLKAERIAHSNSLSTFLADKKAEPLDSAELRAAAALSPADFKTRCAKLRQAARAASKSKAYLDTLLLTLEYALSTGEPLPPEFTAYNIAIQSDADCRLFFTTRQPTSKAAAEKAVENLRALEAKTKVGRPILKILQASLLPSLGKPRDAKDLLHAALRESPHIVGAWRDLGYLYYNDYEMIIAWQWWDAARRTLPASPASKSIDDLERKLVRDHPEFF